MNNDLKVSLENIIPLTYARDHFSSIVAEVQRNKLYILTKGGKPAIALIDVRYLEQITAGVFNKAEIEKDIEKIPEQVGKPKMLEHEQEIKDEKLEVKDAKIEPKPTPPPAGFAAPQPKPAPTPKKEVFDINSDLPKDNPPDLSKATIPITEQPTPTPKVASSAGTISNFSKDDSSAKPLTLPQNEIKTPPAPTPIPKPETGPTIDVSFNQDVNTDQQEKASDKDQLSPDDKVQPAQYAGETPVDDQEEPEEMAID